MKKNIYLLSLLISCSLPTAHAAIPEPEVTVQTQSCGDDDFFNALLAISEQTREQSEAEAAIDAMLDMQALHQEKPEEPSFMQRYLTILVVKGIVWYGDCKTYLVSMINSIRSYLCGE